MRYIGKSDAPFLRFKAHLCDKQSSHKTNWIHALRVDGLVPLCDLLDEVPSDQWQLFEREYIRVFRLLGMRIINCTDGGDGVINLTEELATKRRASMRAAMTPASRARRSAALKGKAKSPETIERMRLAVTPERRAAIIDSLHARQLSIETKQKMRAAALGHKRLLGHKLKPETIAKLRAINMGNKHNLGHTLSPATKAKIAAAQKGNKYCLGHKCSEATKAKIAAKAKERYAAEKTKT